MEENIPVYSVLDAPVKDTTPTSTMGDYFNVMSSPAIVWNNPSLQYKSVMNKGGVDTNDPTFRSLYDQSDAQGKIALGDARSLEHAIAIAGRRKIFEESSRAIEQDPLLVQLGMGLVPSLANYSSVIPVGTLGAMAKLGKQVSRVRNMAVGAGFGAAAGAGMNLADEAVMETQGIQHDYLAAGVMGMLLGGGFGGIGGALAGPYKQSHAKALSVEGDTFTKDFNSDPNIELEMIDGVPKIKAIDDVGRMGKFGLDYIPYIGKFFRSDVHTVYQDPSAVLRSEMTKWANPTVSLKDSKGNVVPTAWNSQNEKALAVGRYNLLRGEIRDIHTQARAQGYKGNYEEFIQEVSAEYTKASAKQEVDMFTKLVQFKEQLKAEQKATKEAEIKKAQQPEAYVREQDNTLRPMTEEEFDITEQAKTAKRDYLNEIEGASGEGVGPVRKRNYVVTEADRTYTKSEPTGKNVESTGIEELDDLFRDQIGTPEMKDVTYTRTDAEMKTLQKSLDEEWEAFKADIGENGIKNDIIVGYRDGRLTVEEGNHRLTAANELGITKIPIRYMDEVPAELRLIDDLRVIPEDKVVLRTKNKKEMGEFKAELETRLRDEMDTKLQQASDKLYQHYTPTFRGNSFVTKAAEGYNKYYNDILKMGQDAKLDGLKGLSENRLYRPRTWNFEGIKKGEVPEAEVKARLHQALASHPNQAGYTKAQLAKATDSIYNEILSRGFDIENMRTSFVIPKELPFEGMLQARRWRMDESKLGPLLKDNLDDVTGAYSYKMSGRVAAGKVTDGQALMKTSDADEFSDYITDLKQRLLDEGQYNEESLQAFARVVEDTIGTLRMHPDSHTPKWTWTRNLMAANSARLGGGFGGNQFIELAANATMLGFSGLVNGRFAKTWQNAGSMLYKGKMPDDQFAHSMVAAGFMDAALHTHRVNRYTDVEQGLNPGIVEKTIFGVQDTMMKVNGMRYFTAVMEDYTGGAIMTHIGRMAKESKLSKSDERRLARWGLTPDQAKAFAADMDLYYRPAEGKFELHKFSEENQGLFQKAIQNGVSEMVVQGDSIHLPNWMKAPGPALRLMTQFMRFPLIAQETLLRRGFTEDQARFVGGIVASTMTYMALKYTREQAAIALGFKEEVDAQFDYFGNNSEEAMRRGVLGSFNYNANLGFMSSLWNYGALATGNPDLGKDYMYDQGIGALAGPTGSLIEDFMTLTTSAANGEFGSDKDQMIIKGGLPFMSLPIISEGVSAFIKE